MSKETFTIKVPVHCTAVDTMGRIAGAGKRVEVSGEEKARLESILSNKSKAVAQEAEPKTEES